MKRALLLIGMLLAFEVQAQATFITGSKLMEFCRGFDQGALNFDRSACVWYVTGVADVMAGDSVTGWRACIVTGSVTNEQVAQVAVTFLREHPEKSHLAAHNLVAMALSGAYPCAK